MNTRTRTLTLETQTVRAETLDTGDLVVLPGFRFVNANNGEPFVTADKVLVVTDVRNLNGDVLVTFSDGTDAQGSRTRFVVERVLR